MKQQTSNIPIVVPFEINAISNTSVYGTIGENSMFVEGDDKVFNDFSVMTSTSTNETTGVGHYYYNFNSSSTGNQEYPELELVINFIRNGRLQQAAQTGLNSLH